MSATTKYKLEEFAEAEECTLIGIISSAPDYTVCWHMNKFLNLNLCRVEDVKLEVVKKNKKEPSINLFSAQEQEQELDNLFSIHHVFKYLDEPFYSDYHLIVNKGTMVNLEPQLKRVTYFLEINGVKSENAEQMVFNLNAIEPIEMAYLIGKESIINKLQLPV